MPLNITSASGKGAILGMAEWGDDDLIVDVERPTPSASLVVNDWFWGSGAPDATVISWTWLEMPLELRADQPINSATISRLGQTGSVANNSTSQTTYGTFSVQASLDTISPDDAANFASFLITYYGNPLLRSPKVTLSLVHRTDEERWRILGRELGDRITLGPGTVQDFPGHTTVLPVPAGLPAAARSFVIEGIRHTSSVTARVVEWTMAPLFGFSPTVKDTFTRIVASGSWGTADTGQAWQTSDAALSVSSGQGLVSQNAGTSVSNVLNVSFVNLDLYVDIGPVAATGAGVGEMAIYARYTSTYAIRFRFAPSPGVAPLVVIDEVVNGVVVATTSAPSVPNVASGDAARLHCQIAGSTARLKAYKVSDAEPDSWLLTLAITSAAAPGALQVVTAPGAGWTNTPPIITTWDNLFLYTPGGNPQNVEGPWFRLGTSQLASTTTAVGPDVVPF